MFCFFVIFFYYLLEWENKVRKIFFKDVTVISSHLVYNCLFIFYVWYWTYVLTCVHYSPPCINKLFIENFKKTIFWKLTILYYLNLLPLSISFAHVCTYFSQNFLLNYNKSCREEFFFPQKIIKLRKFLRKKLKSFLKNWKFNE